MFTRTGILLQLGPHYGPHHGPIGPTGGAGLGFLWGFLWLLVTVLIIVGGAYLATRFLGERETEPGANDALAVLERRFAQGEIDEEEYETQRERLTQS